MSIQINSSIINYRVNRYSDFQLQFSLLKDGVAYVPTQFIMAFYIDEWSGCEDAYVASLIGGVYTNCSVSGNIISVYFNSPGFELGQLKCRVVDMVDNASFTDGTLDTCVPTSFDVFIVASAGDTDNVVLGYGEAYYGDDHDLVFIGAMTPSYGGNNSLII